MQGHTLDVHTKYQTSTSSTAIAYPCWRFMSFLGFALSTLQDETRSYVHLGAGLREAVREDCS